MAGSSFGNQFRITTWGESHGKGLGVVIDGCPAGLSLSEEDIQKYLDRRKPGVSQYVTKRKESDTAKIMSGVFEGRTTGTPISIMVLNEDQRSTDYSDIEMFYRPGHADYTFDSKYGFRDYRGGGRSSGRETIARVAAGAVAAKILKELGIEITAYTQCIGGIGIDYSRFDIEERDRNPFSVPDKEAAVSIENKAKETIENLDSLGGIIECVVKGMPAGIGEPVFDKLDAQLSKAVMSIGATKGIEIGDGFMVAETTGSENNDEFYNDNGHIAKRTNHSGGVLGGIGVFLYGMKLMGDSLEMVAGNEIKRMFAKISNKKLIGVGIGTVTTAVVQSSAAVTVMAIGFVNSGLMTLTQAASIVFGANIGTTSTALIVALGAGGFANVNLTVIFAALAGVGALIIMLTKKDKVKKIGGIITGLGMIFVGLSVMTSSMDIFSKSDKISAFLTKVSNPALLLLFGILFTALIQSSSAVGLSGSRFSAQILNPSFFILLFLSS